MNPLVSVVMAAYNVEAFISEALTSIVTQTYQNWELIIILDGCTDNTLTVAKNFISQNYISDKCRMFVSKDNRGYGFALNNCISLSKGDLVAIVDADDSLADVGALEIMVMEHSKHPNASLIYSDYNEVDFTMRPIKKRRHGPRKNSTIPRGKTILGEFKDGKYVGTQYIVSHFKVFKRKFYDMTDGVDPTLLKAVDRDLVLKLEEVGDLVHIDGYLYNHRVHEHSISEMWKCRSQEYRDKVVEAKNKMYSEALRRRTE